MVGKTHTVSGRTFVAAMRRTETLYKSALTHSTRMVGGPHAILARLAANERNEAFQSALDFVLFDRLLKTTNERPAQWAFDGRGSRDATHLLADLKRGLAKARKRGLNASTKRSVNAMHDLIQWIDQRGLLPMEWL